MKAHRSKYDMSPNAKKAPIEVLNAGVADAIDFAFLTKQAHWNLKGPRHAPLLPYLTL
jgi:starvation-inducible DNA-binding protein